jgi:vancomycin resistance protein YoaR
MWHKKKFIRFFKKYFWTGFWQKVSALFFLAFFVFVSAFSVHAIIYRNAIYPGVWVGELELGKTSVDEAEINFISSIENLREKGIEFLFKERTVTIPMVVFATEDPDLSYDVFSYNTKESVMDAFSIGRRGGFFKQLSERFYSFFWGYTLYPDFYFGEEKVLDILKANLSLYENPPRDARVVFRSNFFELTPESDGVVFDYGLAVLEAKAQIKNISFSPIVMKLESAFPKIKSNEAAKLLSSLVEISKGGSVVFYHNDTKWNWSRDRINTLLEIRLSDDIDEYLEIGVNYEDFEKFFSDIASSINLEPSEPRFALEDKKVVEFKQSASGQKVDMLKTHLLFEKAILENQQEVIIQVDVVEPNQALVDLNDLGIGELLGVGKSSFAGSPRNRRHNIQIGAETLDGILVPPGEEFSLLSALGNIDAEAGYLTELVIKGNKTVPEYGGGLCQIGTTVFRATLDSGMPILERRNHSYTVSYYFDEKGKPGKDATIYNPSPDFRFLNDTKNHILIISKIEKDDLIFEYWGKSDGRVSFESDVRVWDRVLPPPTKYIETLDLAPGEERCTEKPHAGIKAEFDYSIQYPDGTNLERTFFSNYRPWQEVCLIGVEDFSVNAEDDFTGENDENLIEQLN